MGIIQYPCPETTAMGLMRNPQGRQQYDNIFFRNHCKELLQVPMLMVREFLKNRYRLCCFIGLENSPTCGIHWGRHKVNRYGTESPNTDEVYGKNPKDPVLRGIMAEILEEELAKEGITTPFLELPALSPADSDKRKQFWKDLEDALYLYSRIRAGSFLRSLYLIYAEIHFPLNVILLLMYVNI